jgi:gliding motility-associated protein GldM
MAHGKETPRQKMIGMMYLVLTALLALNVAAEVLNAFSLIDDSLRKSTNNIVNRNSDIYSDFAIAMEENPIKTRPWKEKADKVKIKTDVLIEYIQSLKVKIVQTAEGEQGDPNHIQKKDDINVPGQIMITEKENGKQRAVILKEKIDEYRDFLIGIVQDPVNNAGLIDGFKSNLSTDDVLGQEGVPVPWIVAHFEQLPLAGVVALMSKMQSDIRNAESEMLTYLYAEIRGSDIGFNKIEAIVTAPSNYVLMNQSFNAEVFIAASDSTMAPVIKLNDGSTMPVENGKGLYKGSTSTPGIKSFGGVIELKNPKTKEIMTFPFNSEYTVGKASLVVSPTSMNVFYIGVDNPVELSVPGVDPSKVSPYMSGIGSIVKKGNGYVVRVGGNQGNKVRVGANVKLDGQNRNMGYKEFRVKKVPSPVAKVGGKKGGKVSKNWLLAQDGVQAILENFDFKLRYKIVGYNVSFQSSEGYVQEAGSKSARFTEAQKKLLRGVKSNRKVYIEDIKAVGPDKTVRDLGSLTFKIR